MGIMNTYESRLRRPRINVADTVGASRQWPAVSLHVDSVLAVARRTRWAADGWLRDLGSASHLGRDAEQVLGRATGART